MPCSHHTKYLIANLVTTYSVVESSANNVGTVPNVRVYSGPNDKCCFIYYHFDDVFP